MQFVQRVLMARLGFCHFDDEPSVDCLARYADLFKDPLPPSSTDALTKLFALELFSGAVCAGGADFVGVLRVRSLDSGCGPF